MVSNLQPLQFPEESRVPREEIIHRGIGFHGQVFSEPHEVLDHLTGKGAPNPEYASKRDLEAHDYADERRSDLPIAGEHWSRSWAFANGHAGTSDALNTSVVLHATDPHAEMSGAQKRRTGVYVDPAQAHLADHEQEVAVEPGSVMHVHGVTFKGDPRTEKPRPFPQTGWEPHTPVPDRHYAVDWRVQA